MESRRGNRKGGEPAEGIRQAKKFFDDKVDFYVDIGNLGSTPSTVARLYKTGKVEIVREGDVKII